MFNLESNFQSGRPISQVPASWFNRVASFLNNLVGGYGIKLSKQTGGPSTIELDPKAITDIIFTDAGESPVEPGTIPASPDITQEAKVLWPTQESVDSGSGCKIDVFYKVEPDSTGFFLYGATLTFSKSGLLLKVEAIGDGGLYIYQ